MKVGGEMAESLDAGGGLNAWCEDDWEVGSAHIAGTASNSAGTGRWHLGAIAEES